VAETGAGNIAVWYVLIFVDSRKAPAGLTIQAQHAQNPTNISADLSKPVPPTQNPANVSADLTRPDQLSQNLKKTFQ
jgi:hypothetical protein